MPAFSSPPRDPSRRRLALVALAALTLAAAVKAADWPQFRGPHRDGISTEGHLVKTWPAAGPRVLWRVPVGEGYSHLAVAGGRIYTLYATDKDEMLASFEAATGKQAWATRIDSKFLNDQGNGPRSTPTYEDGTLYVLGAQGRLAAVAAATGRKLWEHDLVREFGARSPTWGISSSPLIEGNLLLVAAGGSQGRSVMAFNKRDGKVAWKALDDPAGYAAPIAFTAAGVRQAAFLTGNSLVSLAVADGRLLWRVPWETSLEVNAATPIFIQPDRIFISSGYDMGAAVFRLTRAEGRIGVEPVWKSRVLKTQFSSSLLAGDYLYGFDNATFKCVDARTGEEKWKQRGLGQGSLILADGRLLVLSESGRLSLVDASPDGYVERAGFQALSGRSWVAPSLVDGVLYLRNGDTMLAIDLAEGRQGHAREAL